jgi:hypothetical protein
MVTSYNSFIEERMCKVFIWSLKKKETVPLHFFCPKCDQLSPYSLKPASVDFTFYFIPLFEATTLHEFVVCQVCKKGFDPRILAPGNQSLFKLAWATKCQLSHFSPEALKTKLVSQGLKETLIDKLITLAQN